MGEEVRWEKRVGKRTVRLVVGDLTEQDVDAIVNAANEHLQHGGGVAGAIVKKGGRVIQDESDRIGFTPVGTAVMTSAGRLRARHVIHTVGPRWGEGDEDRKLEGAIRSSLELAEREGLKSISFPAVSAGIFGFPHERCARIISSTLVDYLESHPEGSLQRVEVCLLGGPLVDHFLKALAGLNHGV